MLDGLIICSDRKIYDEFILHFSSDLTVFEHAASVEDAGELANIQTFDYIIAVDQSSEKIHDQIRQLREFEPYKNLPVLCALSSSTAAERKILWEIGIRDIIHLPMSTEELELRLKKFIGDFSIRESDERNVGMQGKLEDYSLIGLVQTLEQNEKTGVLNLYHSRDEGQIWFKNGDIYDAKLSSMENVEAILKMSTWTEGDFAIAFVDEDYERKIFVDNQQILLDALQHMDLRNKLLNLLPPKDESLLISPETDIYKVKEDELKYLRFFQGGQTISAFLSAFDDNELILLEKVKEFIEYKILMTRQEFDSHTTEAERELAETGLKNVFKKLFRGKPGPAKASKKASAQKEDKKGEEEPEKDDHSGDSKKHLFQTQGIDLNRFKQLISKI
jgi:hypothetical protein